LGCFPIAQPPREGAVFISFGAKVGLVILHGKLSLKSKTTKRLKKFIFFERFKTGIDFWKFPSKFIAVDDFLTRAPACQNSSTIRTRRKECLEAVRQWPGCETVGGIQINRGNTPVGFSVRVTIYGKADKKTADRAIICVQREKRRHFHLND
jgi:hypothetical protein